MTAISAVLTINHVAALLGEEEEWLHDLSIDMFPEDGCLCVYERKAGKAPPKPENTG